MYLFFNNTTRQTTSQLLKTLQHQQASVWEEVILHKPLNVTLWTKAREITEFKLFQLHRLAPWEPKRRVFLQN